MADAALPGEATMEVRGPSPGAEHIAAGTVTVTPLEAEVASVVAGGPSLAADVASVAVHVPPEAGDAALVVADMPLVEAATVEAEAEADPMVEGAGRFGHHSKLSRPTAFAVGRFC